MKKELEWYLELKGTKTGPFAPKDIAEMLKAGKIHKDMKTTAARLNGEWISVFELVSAYKELSNAPKSPWAAEFNPPPRPTEQLEVVGQNQYAVEDRENDPNAKLLQAIRNIKERAYQPKTTPVREPSVETQSHPTKASPQMVIVAVLSVLVFGALFALFKVFKSNSSPSNLLVEKQPTHKEVILPKTETLSPKPTGSLLGGDNGGSNAAQKARMPVSQSLPSRTPAPRAENPPESGGAMYENELPPEVLAEMNAAREQDERAARGELKTKQKRSKIPAPESPPLGDEISGEENNEFRENLENEDVAN